MAIIPAMKEIIRQIEERLALLEGIVLALSLASGLEDPKVAVERYLETGELPPEAANASRYLKPGK